MNYSVISQALTTGLLAGYGGKTKFTKTNRGSFKLNSSHFDDGHIVYHDEWVNGGGQELVKVGSESFTRVYAGSAIGESRQTIQKLIFFIQKLGPSTRLFSDCRSVDGDWIYEYRIIHQDPSFNLTVGQETIIYQGNLVFKHIFVLSPVT